MQISPVSSTNQPANTKKIWKHPLRDTGYTSAVLGVASGIAGSQKKIKLHKYLVLCSKEWVEHNA